MPLLPNYALIRPLLEKKGKSKKDTREKDDEPMDESDSHHEGVREGVRTEQVETTQAPQPENSFKQEEIPFKPERKAEQASTEQDCKETCEHKACEHKDVIPQSTPEFFESGINDVESVRLLLKNLTPELLKALAPEFQKIIAQLSNLSESQLVVEAGQKLIPMH